MDDKKMVCDAVEPFDNSNGDDSQDNGQNDADQEYELLNEQLDQLHSVLDDLEHKTNAVHAQFVELLKSNRETREELHQASLKNDDDKNNEKNSSLK
ncbi:bublin coiled-coil protein [Microplitis demolitor]|uniref:bublin coiled-coil protein n=1 Tax=Microplitis demolitor TaxID=69319 RepID=UPI0004CD0368|nr:bublin coiled-coil protein [Microplitis demolitor]